MLEQRNSTVTLSNDDEFTPLNSSLNGALMVQSADDKSSHRKLELMWCGGDNCKESIRERVGENNNFEFDGPATGQVCFTWDDSDQCQVVEDTAGATASVLFLVKKKDEELMRVAADAIKQLAESGIRVYLVPDAAAKIEHIYGVNSNNIHLFEPRTTPGFFGTHVSHDDAWMLNRYQESPENQPAGPDIICTLGGDGLLMHANVMFQGPVPPILCVAGGSLGFLTPFSRDEMVNAIRISLGLVRGDGALDMCSDDNPVAIKPYDVLKRSDHFLGAHSNGSGESTSEVPRFKFGLGNKVCISMRMRLECKVINREGVVRARFNVLNEVTVDRGGSPYLAALECFCDNVHLTTVQADGVIFAT